jgi:hemerythrin-like domain-containing protein
MKDHKPIKRSKAFIQFSKEHHFGLLLIWQIRQDIVKGVDAGQIGSYVLNFFNNDLRRHFKEEDELIFSKLPVEDPMRKQAEAEHSQLYLLVESLAKNKNDKQSLHLFADLLEAHIRFEERSLFNRLQEMLKPEELEELLLKTSTKESSVSP